MDFMDFSGPEKLMDFSEPTIQKNGLFISGLQKIENQWNKKFS